MTSYKASTSESLSIPIDVIYSFLPKAFQVNYTVDKRMINALFLEDSEDLKIPNINVLAEEIQNITFEDKGLGKDRKEKTFSDDDVNGELNVANTISITQMIDALSFSNAKIPTLAKQRLLHDIFLDFASSNIDIDFIEQTHINILFKVLTNNSCSDIEKFFAFKSLILVSVIFMEDYGNFIFGKLEQYVKQNVGNSNSETLDPTTKSYLIVGYFTMFLIFNEGTSHIPDIESVVDYWLNLLTAITDLKKEAGVAVAIINGLSILLSIDNDVHELNESIETLIPSLILYLSSEPRTAIVAGSLISQCFQDFTFFEHQDDSELPYYDKQEIKDLFEQNLRESSKSISKDERKKLHCSFRNMISTLDCNLDLSARKEFQELGSKREKLGYIVLNGNRKHVLSFFSWGYLTRINHLRWLFGSGLTNFLFDNTGYLSLLTEPRHAFGGSADSDNNCFAMDEDEPKGFRKSSTFNGRVDRKKADIAIRKARFAKVTLNQEVSDDI